MTSLPPNTQLLGVTLSNGIATIDMAFTGGFDGAALNGEFASLDGRGAGPVHTFAQLVLTATQFPFVDGVLFKLDGQPLWATIDKPSEVEGVIPLGEIVERPVTRADYEFYRGEDLISEQGPGT